MGARDWAPGRPSGDGAASESQSGNDDRMRAMARSQRLIQRKKGGAAGARAPIPEAGGSPLDRSVRARMEPRLGADLSEVRVHTGSESSSAAEGYGARAFTVGNDVHFGSGQYEPGSREGDRLIAHELTHVVQGQRAGVQRKENGTDGAEGEAEQVSQPGDPAEVEANQVADQVVDGGEAEAAGGEAGAADGVAAAAPAIGRVPQNPQELTDSHGNNTTTHAEPGLGEGYGHEVDPHHGSPGGECGPMDVAILHDESNPLLIDGTPNQDDLFQQVGAGGGGQHVEQRQGSVAQPYVDEKVDPDTMYIGSGPVDQDIQQGSIGDCYYLAALHQICTRDPSKLTGMMSLAGNTFTATLNHFDQASNTYQPASVAADRTLVHDVDAKTGATEGIHGSGFRVAPQPKRSEWFCKVNGNTLHTIRRDYYETAMWAPLLEKAYARFTEQYGQYGGAPDPNGNANAQTDSAGNQNSGYEIIDGGFENQVYNMFYGSAVASHAETQTNFNPNSSVVQDNLPTMQRLLQLGGDGLQAGQQLMMTASADYATMFGRLKPLVDAALADPGTRHWPAEFGRSCHYLSELADHYAHVANDQKKEPKAKDKVASTAREIAAPHAWPMLHRDSAPDAAKHLLEVLMDVANVGTDNDAGNARMIYTEHAYSVTGLHIKDSHGADLHVDQATLVQQAPNIDAEQSQVTVRNPHRMNEPDVNGTGNPDDGSANDGNFTISLNQFFRNFAAIDFAVIQH